MKIQERIEEVLQKYLFQPVTPELKLQIQKEIYPIIDEYFDTIYPEFKIWPVPAEEPNSVKFKINLPMPEGVIQPDLPGEDECDSIWDGYNGS